MFNWDPFAGWDLVHFDPEEYKIKDVEDLDEGHEDMQNLASIPNLGKQWKVIHEFKPTVFMGPSTGLKMTTNLGGPFLGIVFVHPSMPLRTGGASPPRASAGFCAGHHSGRCQRRELVRDQPIARTWAVDQD